MNFTAWITCPAGTDTGPLTLALIREGFTVGVGKIVTNSGWSNIPINLDSPGNEITTPANVDMPRPDMGDVSVIFTRLLKEVCSSVVSFVIVAAYLRRIDVVPTGTGNKISTHTSHVSYYGLLGKAPPPTPTAWSHLADEGLG